MRLTVGFFETVEAEMAFMDTLVLYLLAMFAIAFVALMLGLAAPYGRYAAGASALFGFEVPGLFAWVVQEMPNLLAVVICSCFFANKRCLDSSPNQLLLLMFTVHYINRTLVFPFRIRGGKPSKLMPFLMATAFCTVNGYLQARTLTYIIVYPEAWLFHPQFVAGVVVFFTGFALNLHHDAILRDLRKPGETGYKIPRGGLFDYVSGANFLSEIIEWTGFALAAGSKPAVCFAITTALNIGPRAVQHHQWYLTKFDDYPKERKALIPYLF